MNAPKRCTASAYWGLLSHTSNGPPSAEPALGPAFISSAMRRCSAESGCDSFDNLEFIDPSGRRNRGRGRIDCVRQALDNHVDHRGVSDKGRGDKNVVTALSIERSTHRINRQPTLHRLAFYSTVQFELGRESLLGASVFDELNSPEQPSTANITDESMLAQPPAEAIFQPRALAPNIFQQSVPSNDSLDCKGSST